VDSPKHGKLDPNNEPHIGIVLKHPKPVVSFLGANPTNRLKQNTRVLSDSYEDRQPKNIQKNVEYLALCVYQLMEVGGWERN
jgi:hypothetical protein